jgi:LuxR family maltose regulon positive regulatory protein
VTLVAAPVGYGKTIAVAQALADQQLPVAWLAVGPEHDDPVRLQQELWSALSRIGRPPLRAVPASDDRLPDGPDPEPLVDSLAAVPAAAVVVIDDLDRLRSPEVAEVLDQLIADLSPQVRLVLISRADPPVRLARCRAQGLLSELRVEELAFTRDEALDLLTAHAVHLGPAALTDLVDRTEGWPALLELTAWSAANRADAEDVIDRMLGTDRFVVDYLSEEVLDRQPADLRRVVLGLALLDTFCGPLADHALGIGASAAVIRRLERDNMFVVSLDASGEWYRFQRPFQVVARAIMELDHPEEAQRIHSRAAEWLERHGDVEAALPQAIAAGDLDTAVRLVGARWMDDVSHGRRARLDRWVRELATHRPHEPTILAIQAWLAAVTTTSAELTSRLDRLRALPDQSPLPDGVSSPATVAELITGLVGIGEPDAIVAAARRALDLEPDRFSRWHALATFALGHALYLSGDEQGAVSQLREPAFTASAPSGVRAGALALLSIIEAERGGAGRDDPLAVQAIRLVETDHLSSGPAVLAYAAIGRQLALQGRLAEAVDQLEHGLGWCRRLGHLGRWWSVHHQLILARVLATAGDEDRVGQLLAEVDGVLTTVPTATAMRSRLRTVEELLRARRLVRTQAPPVEPLTPREIDILRRLGGPRSLSRIAADLYLSPNTVKSHVAAIYRKLDVHSRTDAIDAAVRERLIGPPTTAGSVS